MTKEVWNLVFSERVKYQNDLEFYWVVSTTAHVFENGYPHNKTSFTVFLDQYFIQLYWGGVYMRDGTG